MGDWIKFQRELTQGEKRGLSRATRFIYCELCLQARARRGVVKLPARGEVVDAVHDLIGGDRSEVARAMTDLTVSECDDEPMIIVATEPGRRELRIAAWAKFNSGEDLTAAERQMRARDKRRTEQGGEHVYFVRRESDGLIKIGFSNSVVDRVRHLSGELRTRIDILATISGGAALEASLHERFAHLRVRGEWFRPEGALAEYMNELTGREPGSHQDHGRNHGPSHSLHTVGSHPGHNPREDSEEKRREEKHASNSIQGGRFAPTPEPASGRVERGSDRERIAEALTRFGSLADRCGGADALAELLDAATPEGATESAPEVARLACVQVQTELAGGKRLHSVPAVVVAAYKRLHARPDQLASARGSSKFGPRDPDARTDVDHELAEMARLEAETADRRRRDRDERVVRFRAPAGPATGGALFAPPARPRASDGSRTGGAA